jgi:hypothetical protein
MTHPPLSQRRKTKTHHEENKIMRNQSNIENAYIIRIKRNISFNGSPLVYYHYGVLFKCKEEEEFIIHYSGDLKSELVDALITLGSWEDFLKGADLSDVEFVDDLNKDKKYRKKPLSQCVESAFSRLGESNFHLITNNSEMFCYSCVYGVNYSSQINNITSQLQELFKQFHNLFGIQT